MTGKQQIIVERVYDLCADMYGPVFCGVLCAPIVSKDSTLFPIEVDLDYSVVGGPSHVIKRYRSLGDLELAAKGSLPR